MVKASVIIPALNEEHYIEKTFKSIVKQTLPRGEYEIIVSDGKSTDKTVRIAKKYADKIISRKNKTIGEARNLGAAKAKGEYLIFIDADTEVEPTLFESVIDSMSDKKVVGGFVNYRYKTKNFIIKILSILFDVLNYLLVLVIPRESICAGVCMFARGKTFQQVKGFDESLKTSEDKDLANKLRSKGSFVLINEIVYTSDRRLKKMGFFGLIKYYLSDLLHHIINKDFKGEYVKVD